MNTENRESIQKNLHGNIVILSIVALFSGVLTGLLGALFRLALHKANHLRDVLIAWAHIRGIGGFAIFLVLVATCAAVAAWLVRRVSPDAGGSGIPQVEAVFRGELSPPVEVHLIFTKFFGGLLAIGSGLALGREGPTVQMGAIISYLTAKWFRRSREDCLALLAAGAGAGLATAFNAPIAGAVFVLEELIQRFNTRIAIMALATSATAIWVERLVLGNHPCFMVSDLLKPNFLQEPLFLLLGIIAGFAGIAYNKMLINGLRVADFLSMIPVEFRAAIVGVVVAVTAWFAPTLVGGGDPITQQILYGIGPLTILPFLYLFRFVLSTASYAAGTPGGIFAPLLVLGAVLGLLVGKLFLLALPSIGIQPEGFALVGMAALFTAIVRAPITGIILVVEMTETANMTLPMIVACFAAMIVPTYFGNNPIYKSLGSRLHTSHKDSSEF